MSFKGVPVFFLMNSRTPSIHSGIHCYSSRCYIHLVVDTSFCAVNSYAPLYRKWPSEPGPQIPVKGSLRAPWDHLEHQKSGSLRAPENHTFGVTLGDMGLGRGVRHSNLIIFLAVLQTQALHCSFMISYRWGGVGWGGVITFMFLCTHRRDVPATS